ncbi:hydantoinase/oxoprolinase family protein [Flavisphingomonas formosensis]|uniref:hydantoinase/oxoprolinase family protein n=1 Tax=Flavisphingomonas formosensis TaxID=861534 RepID=UPI0012F76ADE|nr:hydantoinase/oxoprolinase family protein [Sphingomonas formosensis]
MAEHEPAIGYRFAADIGGTFTDIACLSPDGVLATRKLPSTPEDYARAIVDGIGALAAELGIGLDRLEEVLHASTIATNAILEGKGARTALITTRGFRDVLELRRIRVPRLYEPLYEKPAPLVPRRHRFELAERMGPAGETLIPLDLDEVRALAARLAEAEIEAVAVCFLHSYANSGHERAVAEILREALPGRFLSISCDVLPEIREYERTSTTVVNAYIGPVVADYLCSLQQRLGEAGIAGRLLMMQSSGGTLDVAQVIARPATVVESGPAAGVVGAARLGGRSGHGDLITFDMGGTTAKASLVEGGDVVATDEYEVGGGISLNSRMVKGGGYALKLPVIDVSEVGAGGGSIVRIDAGGALKVGPDSAGASPGPACYGAGGTEATVTDANVVLGYLNPDALAGGSVPIDASLSRAALGRIADALGRDLLDVAHGVHRLANATMMRAVKAVSTYRGRDPRDFTLFAFGGNGGVHAAALAAELGMTHILVPPGAGVFSAVGLLFADFEVSHTLAWRHPLGADAPALLAGHLAALEEKVLAEMRTHEPVRLRWRADLRYRGQGFELPVAIPRGPVTEETLAAIRASFEAEHIRSYGHALGNHRVDFVSLRVTGTLPPRGPSGIAGVRQSIAPAAGDRPVYFGAGHGLIATPLIGRTALDGVARAGPFVIEEYEGTTLVPPGATAARDADDNIVIRLPDGGAS